MFARKRELVYYFAGRVGMLVKSQSIRRTPVCSSTSLAVQVARFEQLPPKSCAISVMATENPIHLGLGILNSRLEVLQQPTEDHIPFLPFRWNLDQPFSAKEDIENFFSQSVHSVAMGSSYINSTNSVSRQVLNRSVIHGLFRDTALAG